MSSYKTTSSLQKINYAFPTDSYQKTIFICLLFLTSFFAGQVLADGKKLSINNNQLLASCKTLSANSKDTNTSMCTSYIQGFLAGAWGVKNVKATRLSVKNQEPLSWTERAYRNRVGNRVGKNSSKPVTYYCSPDDEPELRILEKLNNDLVTPIKTLQQLNSQIYEAIKAICPSDKTDGK